MKKLKLRREVVRDLVPQELRTVVGAASKPCTTAISCTDPLGCLPTSITRNIAIGPSLQGCTTAINCP